MAERRQTGLFCFLDRARVRNAELSSASPRGRASLCTAAQSRDYQLSMKTGGLRIFASADVPTHPAKVWSASVTLSDRTPHGAV